MGSGKSTTGRLIAKMSGLSFYDADHEIEQRSGVAISWIFESEGETGFRKREQDMLTDLTKFSRIVLATGGGCVVTPINRQHLKENGLVCYLRVSVDIQLARISAKKSKRPMFVAHNSREKLTELNQQREPFYTEIADFVYDTDHTPPLIIAQKIIADWQRYGEDNP